MQNEYEATFLDIDRDALITKLREQGATQSMPRTKMERLIFNNDFVTSHRGWVRVRNEGKAITMTYKATQGDNTIDQITEIELEVSDMDKARQMLLAVGLNQLRHQENYREEWVLDGVKYDFDEWPDLPQLVEIEGESEAIVRAASEQLGLNYSQASFGSIDEVYLELLGRDILSESELRFK